jgi:hypothetical protein
MFALFVIWIKVTPAAPCQALPQMERAQHLRRRIDLYRRYLLEGVDAELAQTYLREIADAEAALAEIEGTDRRE